MFSEKLYERALSDPSRTAVGWAGEAWLDAIFSLNPRYVVERCKYGSKQGDLKIIDTGTGEVAHVEVKTARRCSDGKWRFTLRKVGHTDYSNCNFVVLLAVRKTGVPTVFVIPVADIERKSQICISSDPDAYQGRYAKYRVSRRALGTLDLSEFAPADSSFVL